MFFRLSFRSSKVSNVFKTKKKLLVEFLGIFTFDVPLSLLLKTTNAFDNIRSAKFLYRVSFGESVH